MLCVKHLSLLLFVFREKLLVGVGLAASADYAIAHSSAFVKLSELAVGIGPFVVGPAVERKMGKSAFTKLTVHATQWQSAQWAEQHGLFAEVHDTIEKVDLAVSKLVENLKFSNPEAMKMLKKNILGRY